MLSELKRNYPALTKLLTQFIQEEVTRIGLHKTVIGLSGGIDSALSAFLTSAALGPENVLCLMMPYKTSSAESLIDAERVIKQLGVRSERIDITPMVDPFFQIEPDMGNIRMGNVMARQRMIVLYDRSSRENGIVIGTGNKTEILLGYTTLFGDSACAINPLGDLYKSQVWKLAAYLDIPKEIIEKAPSADLWEGQTDETELGVSYKRVDELLYFMVDERLSTDELIAKGFEESFVTKITGMIQRAQFKRVPPVIAKISQRTIGVDFRYPRDWAT